MKVIQTRLKAVFESLSITANAFALRHGIHVPTIYGFVNGTRNPNYETLVLICEAEPRISAEYLLRGEGEPLRDKRRASDLTTVEELRAFKVEMDEALDRRIEELSATTQHL